MIFQPCQPISIPISYKILKSYILLSSINPLSGFSADVWKNDSSRLDFYVPEETSKIKSPNS